MLTLIASTPRRNALPLQYATSFSFTTGEDGDEVGTIELDASVATLADHFQIGDSCAVWCNRTHRVVWRGSLEVIERAPSGALQLGLVGFGALQREATASVVVGVFQIDYWKTLETWQLSGSYQSRPSDWKVEYRTHSNFISVSTARTGTYDNTSQVAFVFLFPNEHHYKTITADEKIEVSVPSATGLFNTTGNGVRVSRIDSTNLPFSPVSYSLLSTPGTATYTAPSYTTRGWIIITACNGNETVVGASSANIYIKINSSFLTNISAPRISSALTVNGGFCTYMLPTLYGVQGLIKPDATAKDIFDTLYYHPVPAQPFRYDKKRFIRNSENVVYNFLGNRQTWRVYDAIDVQNISRKASAIFMQYKMWYGDWFNLGSTDDRNVRNVRSRRRLNERTFNAGLSGMFTAEVTRDKIASDIEQTPTELTIELSNENDALATRNGSMIPNWCADVGDEMIIPTYFRPLQIVARTITRDSVTYELVGADNTLTQFVRSR